MKAIREIIFIAIILSAMNCFAQDKCLAIINWKYLRPVELYDKPGGNVVETIKNDSASEDYLHLDIIEQTDAYFNVIISSIKISNKRGWIRKADYIGAYKKHEKFPMDLTIYKDKNVIDSNKIVIKDWTPDLLTIINCDGKWTFVSLTQNKKKYEGWIETGELCANAYTYCN